MHGKISADGCSIMAKVQPQNDLVELFIRLSAVPVEYADRRQALKRIAELGRQAMNATACTLSSVNLERRYLQQLACAGLDATYEAETADRKIPLGSRSEGNSLDYEQAARGELFECYGLQDDGQGIANPQVARRYGLDSALCCPLWYRNRLIGYFNVFSSGTTPFTDEDRRLAQVFARQAVNTIQLLDNRDELANQQRLVRLNEIMQETTEIRNVEQLLGLMLERGLELAGCTRGWISRLNFDTGELQIVAQEGQLPEMRRLQIGQGLTGKALSEGRPIRADNVHDSCWAGIYEEFWPDTQSELAVPLLLNNVEVRVGREVKLGQKPVGVFNVESPSPHAFSKTDENLLWPLARHTAFLIDRLELDHKLARLAKVEQDMIGKQDWNDIIESMMRAITENLGYRYVNISLVDREHNRIRTEYVKGVSEQEAVAMKRLADHSLDSKDIQADIVRTAHIEVPDINDPRFDPEIYGRFGHQRLIRVFVPMVASSMMGTEDSRVMGTVEAGYSRQHRQYIYEQDIQILKNLVDYAVRALEQRQRGLLELIGHELRTPVVGIRSNASFLQRRVQELDEQVVQRKFDDILTDCDILLFQVKELEYLLGREPPPPKLERTLIFRDVIIKSLRQLKPLMIERNFDTSKVYYDASDIRRIRPLFIDRRQLNQVVGNLLVNSIKYAEDEPQKFAIRIGVELTRDSYVIVFKDWGIGIRPQYSEKVFEAGFRAPEAIGRYVTGSGLGLTISRKIMRELGGDLRLVNTSKPTEFHVVLPKFLAEVPHDSRYR